MVRPMKFYACYDHGSIFAVLEGTTAARRACGGRRHYFAFRTRLAAEEYAMWWNHEHVPWHLTPVARPFPRNEPLTATA